MAEWSSFSLVPTEFIAEGETVVSLGEFTGVHGATGKASRARYAHVWTIRDSKKVLHRISKEQAMKNTISSGTLTLWRRSRRSSIV